MNVAPKIYDAEFYRQELDGQENRLNILKSRQVKRQSKFNEIRNKRSTAPRQHADAAAKVRVPRDQGRDSSIEDAVLRALNDDNLELPCTLDVFVDRLDNKPHHGDVAAVLRSLHKREHKDKNEPNTSLSVELTNADNARRMSIAAIHRSKEETSTKRHRNE